MKKLLIGLSLLALSASASAGDFFGGNSGEWKQGPYGPYYEESDWPEWTPMYWMDEMMDSFDDEEDGGSFGNMPFMGNNNFGNMPFMGNNSYPMMPYGGAPMMAPQMQMPYAAPQMGVPMMAPMPAPQMQVAPAPMMPAPMAAPAPGATPGPAN